MFAYSDSAVGLIQTHFYLPYQLHGDTKINDNTTQDHLPNLKSINS